MNHITLRIEHLDDEWAAQQDLADMAFVTAWMAARGRRDAFWGPGFARTVLSGQSLVGDETSSRGSSVDALWAMQIEQARRLSADPPGVVFAGEAGVSLALAHGEPTLRRNDPPPEALFVKAGGSPQGPKKGRKMLLWKAGDIKTDKICCPKSIDVTITGPAAGDCTGKVTMKVVVEFDDEGTQKQTGVCACKCCEVKQLQYSLLMDSGGTFGNLSDAMKEAMGDRYPFNPSATPNSKDLDDPTITIPITQQQHAKMNKEMAARERKASSVRGQPAGTVRREYAQDIGVRRTRGDARRTREGGLTQDRDDFTPWSIPKLYRGGFPAEALKKYIRDRWYGHGGAAAGPRSQRHPKTKWTLPAGGGGGGGGGGAGAGKSCKVEYEDEIQFPCAGTNGTMRYFTSIIVVAKPKDCDGETKSKQVEFDASCKTKKTKDKEPTDCAADSLTRIGGTNTGAPWA